MGTSIWDALTAFLAFAARQITLISVFNNNLFHKRISYFDVWPLYQKYLSKLLNISSFISD